MSLSADRPTTFLFVRHAQTVWNRERRHAGSAEVPLSDAAEGQILHLTRELLEYPIQSIYSSPLSRCQLTVQPLAEILALPIRTLPHLLERNLGDWEGKTPEDLAPQYPGYHFPDSAYSPAFDIPRAEPLSKLIARLQHFLREAQQKHAGQTVLVSTHSGIIWTLERELVENPPLEPPWPSNGSIAVIHAQGNRYHYQETRLLPG